MAYERSIRRFRNWYVTLLRLYPKQYRERFGEPMEQTFNDLLRERAAEKERLFGFVLWMFVETFAGIVRENMRVIIMQNIATRLAAYRIAVGIALAAALLLLWFNAAVAEPGDSPGPIFFGVVAILVIGAIIARFEPQGMAYALFATALAQMLVAVIAIIAWGQYVEILALNGFFILLWVGSALLFRRAARLGRDVEWTL
jgi:hypothetical protein